MWISPAIFDWEPMVTGWSVAEADGWRRPYEHWNHAEGLLSKATTEFVRIDIVTTLKRAFDRRLQHLEAMYSFKALPLTGQPRRRLERLAFIGLLRPLLIDKLVDIRNRIEHEDRGTPSTEYCAELLDVVWYFLRSTDSLVRQRTIDIEFDPTHRPGGPYRFSLSVDYSSQWSVKLKGWIPYTMTSTVEVVGWLHVAVDELKHAADYRQISKEDAKHEWEIAQAARDPRDVHLQARLLGPEQQCLMVYQHFLGLR